MNNSDRLRQHGYVPTIEIWPRRTKEKRPMHHEVIPDDISKHDETFSHIYSILEKRPMMLGEWNSIFRKRSNINSCGRDFMMFEHWVARNHPGHMPYTSTWDELDGCTRASWRECNDRMIPSHNTVFVCLLGISYSH